MSKNTITTGKMGDIRNLDTSSAGSTTTPREGSSRQHSELPSLSKLKQTTGGEPQELENVVPQNQTPSQKTSPYEIIGAGDPVNMATGEYIYEDKDFILPDMEGEYSLTRRYTGSLKKKPDRSIGKAWALSTDTFVTEEENEATVTMPDGKTAEYIKHNGRYINKKGGTRKHTLKKGESGYIFTDSVEKIKYYYNESGKIEKKTDRNGNITEYRYNEYGIEKIILPTGYTLTFRRENMKISSVTDSTGRTVNYEYEKGLLTKVTRCDGTEIKYTYDEEENLKTVTDGSGCTYLENEYDDSHRVIRQQIADGGEYAYTYDEKNRTNTITEEKSNSNTTYEYNKNYDIT